MAGGVRDDYRDVAVTWAPGSSAPTRVSGLRTDLNSSATHINARGDMIGTYADSNYYGKGGFLIVDGQLQTVTGLGGA